MGWANVDFEDAEPVQEDALTAALRQTSSLVDRSRCGRTRDGLASSSLSSSSVQTYRPLPSGRVDVTRLADANADSVSSERISAVQFHSSSKLIMVSGVDRWCKLFRVDGEKNEKVLGARFNDMHILSASFVGASDELVLSGRKPYFFCYDITTGQTSRINGETRE